jgi:hypothetical protein
MFILNLNEHPDVLCWLPHGRGFIITDKKRLEKEILPKYFKVSKFTSFTRRLNRWEFTIHTMGHKKSSYFHPKFIRHEPRLCLEMIPAPQPKKTKSIVATKKQNQQKKATVEEDQSKIKIDGEPKMAMIEPNKHFSAKNMPSLPEDEAKRIVNRNQQLLYSLSGNPLQQLPATGMQLYNQQLALDQSMAMAAVENSYFPSAGGLSVLPYATQPQHHSYLSMSQQGLIRGLPASQGVSFPGNVQQHMPSTRILLPAQQDFRYMSSQYGAAAYPAALSSNMAQQHIVGAQAESSASPSSH